MNRAENRRAPPGRARRDEVAHTPGAAPVLPKAPAWSPREGLLGLRWVTRRGPEPSRPPRVPTDRASLEVLVVSETAAVERVPPCVVTPRCACQGGDFRRQVAVGTFS